MLRIALGTTEGAVLGTPDGDNLELGKVLGEGLLLGTALGMSVGHVGDSPLGDGVLVTCLQIPRCVMAVGPNKNTSTRDTIGTSRTMFLNELGPTGETEKDLVARVESVIWIHTSSTTLSRPSSSTSSMGVTKSKVILPPNSFAFHCAFPPVCWMIKTLP
jgi:hypothetical protein